MVESDEINSREKEGELAQQEKQRKVAKRGRERSTESDGVSVWCV